MSAFNTILSRIPFVRRYQSRWVLFIAVSWTIADLIWIHYFHFSINLKGEAPFSYNSTRAILLRGVIVSLMSSMMGFILIFKLRQVFRNVPLIINLLAKTSILLLAAIIMNFLLYLTYSSLIQQLPINVGIARFSKDAASIAWLLHHSLGWVVLFLITQLAIEFYEKYSPGVFWDIFIGRYIQPKVRKRIIMFLDLTDSTPIAEKLDSTMYFSFIRDFIYYVSVAILEYHGRVYQYVGDEIVVYWKNSPENKKNCINSLILSSKLLERKSDYFRKRYGFIPQFKAGIHVGEVTVGEIGIIKKDILMGGDIMNTTSRICSICGELHKKYIISKEFLNGMEMNLPIEPLGTVDLKGKAQGVELFALKIK